MRAGVCTVQQALTAEAANLVKQALALARRRGHAQVTPLHVASAMLASSTGLLRRACLQSHSHPLQFRALELCFNVALNRLPASTSSPLLGLHHSHHPSLSNALVAAFKRAQAHQRRGSIENQQQPILALKIELEHLIISILDDPSVSRVMREAGFSSTQVKSKVEQTVSLEIFSQTPSAKENAKPHVLGANVSHSTSHTQVGFGLSLGKPQDQVRNEDVTNVLNTIVNKRENTVIIGESVAIAESVVRGVMDKFEKGLVSGDLRYVQFISLPLFSLRNLPKDEVEQKIVELKCLVKSYMGRGVVLYLGDLKWISEFWSSYGEQRRNYYCPLEHIIMELKRLVCGIRETGKLFLMGIATFQTYMKCKTGHPSLETIWELCPLTISVDGLSLSLNLDSDSQLQYRTKESIDAISWPLPEAAVNKSHTSFTDGFLNFDKEAQRTAIVSSSSSLPSWLQNYKEESKTNPAHDKGSVNVGDLCKKWNLFGSSTDKEQYNPGETLNISPLSSSSSPNSNSSKERNTTNLSWTVIFEPKKSPKEHQFWISENTDEGYGLPLRNHHKPDLLSNPNSSPNSASSSEAIEEDIDGLNEFKVINAENLNILCNALEKKVPWQKEVIPEIVRTILECRSGMRKVKSWLKQRELKDETWLCFLGADYEAKRKIARELARLIFGSQTNFASISLSNLASTRADSNEDKKRKRDESGSSYVQRFSEALNENPHRVFFMEDMEQADYCSQKGIKQAIESGRITVSDDETVPVKDAIIIFSCESFSSLSRACSPRRRPNISETEEIKELEMEQKNTSVSLDLNIAIEDDSAEESSRIGDIGILQYVDNQFIFRVEEL
ncbi:protein SMAX1-LIKE 3-like [Durio zibethinus]|uniref:Protein SMAX1-LIKE 3-like n=1 Tax=Durio zibethinus TaxID=66656 RepID=A0A6P5YTV7_DURZI|nr:protein SMAX1-LIKE 3-like [Durio zibethinus]